MAYVKTLWVPGALPSITAAQLNRMEDGIGDAHAGIRKTPSCRLHRSAAWAALADDGGFHDLAGGWDVEAWDNDGMHDMTTNPDRITFQTAGIYLCTLALNAPSGAGERFGGIFGKLTVLDAVNTYELDRDQRPAYANDIVGLRVVTPVQAAVGDYIFARAGSYQKGSTASYGVNNAVAGKGYGEPHFAAVKIGDIG